MNTSDHRPLAASLLLAMILAMILVFALPAALAAQEEDEAAPPDGMPFSLGQGYSLFQDNCARCHGPALGGTDEGPPLVHDYYEPGHHSDAAFYRAIEQGSPQHHWNFGDMSPVPGVNRDEAGAIIEFIRWFQRDAGLY